MNAEGDLLEGISRSTAGCWDGVPTTESYEVCSQRYRMIWGTTLYQSLP